MRWFVMAWMVGGCGPKVAPTAATPAATPAEPPAATAPAPRVFRWRVADATPTPDGLKALLTDYYDVQVLLAVEPAGDAVSVLVAGARPDGTQDRCTPTTALTAPLHDGAFTIADADVGYGAADVRGTLRRTAIAGAVTTGAEGGLTLATVSGLVDTRELLTLLGADKDDALCTMIPALGPCVACPDGAERCWAVSFAGATVAGSDTPVVPRPHDEVCADATCAGAPACNR
ncbi:MAG: hypothetical protein ABMB14_33375 [Myxococcota bacterium]